MFFNPDEVIKRNFLLNFIVSQRGSGKTFSTLLKMVELYKETGQHFVYVRRTESELDLATPSLMQQLQNEGYYTEDVFKINKNIIYINGKEMGRCVSISTAYKLKSVSFSKVKIIVFDEFISENNKYLKGEPEKFLSLVESIGRMRDISILMLGNQISKYNPYYIYFKVKPAGKTFTRFRDRSILIYEFSSEEYKKRKLETKFGKLVSGTKYGNFMLNNDAINDDYSFIDPLKGEKKFPLANIIIEENNIAVYECYFDCTSLMFFAVRDRIKDKSTINYDKMLVENATIESLRSHPFSNRISLYLSMGKIRFKDMETKLLIQNFIF